MCGLFGFIGTNPDVELLNYLASSAARRGPDGWGYFDGKKIHKHIGKYEKQDYSGKNIVLGHCRLHTIIGTSKELSFIQPIHYKTNIICFNGVLPSYEGLSDTEFLIKNVQSNGIMHVLSEIETENYAIVNLCLVSKKITIAVRNMSFYLLRDNHNTYWCSNAFNGANKFESITII